MKYRAFRSLSDGDCLTNVQEIKAYFDDNSEAHIIQAGDPWLVYNKLSNLAQVRSELKHWGHQITLIHMSGQKLDLFEFQILEFFDTMND